MKLVFLGPPGAGKGTLATLAKEAFGIVHISTGDIFRANIKNGTPLGVKVKAILDSGGLVPDDVTIEIVKDRLAQADCKAGYLLDGFPRTVVQAEALAGFETLDAVANFVLADTEIVARLSGRRADSSPGAGESGGLAGGGSCVDTRVHLLPPVISCFLAARARERPPLQVRVR